MEVGVRQAKVDLSKLIKSVLQGEKVVITNHGKPLVELVPAPQKPKSANRGYGMFKGQFTMPSAEEWRKADEEIASLFYDREPRDR